MNRTPDINSYDPMATSQLAARATDGGTDKHQLERIRWAAIENLTAGVNGLTERLVKLETTLNNLKWLIGIAIGLFGLLETIHK